MIKFSILKVLLIVLSVGLCSLNAKKLMSRKNQIDDNLLLNGSKKFESWINSSNVSHFLNFCVFNVTNANLVSQGEFPILQEICGFKLNQNKRMEVIGWTKDEKYVNVKLITDYGAFEKDSDPNITTLNLPLVYVHTWLDNSVTNWAVRRILNKFLAKYPLFITKSASDFLLRGYKDEILIETQKYLNELDLRLYLPTRVHEAGIYSFVNHKLSSYSGNWTVNTGKFNLKDLGQVAFINGKSRTSVWNRPCNLINGTDGFIHNPLINETNTISIYVPEMNRSVEHIYNPLKEDNKIKFFQISNKTFASGNTYWPNQCYIKDSDEINQYDGVLRMPTSKKNALPIAYSFPRFENADIFFKNQVEILEARLFPDPFISYKKTGEIDRKKITLQVNIDIKSISSALNLERMIFPIYWFIDWSIGTD